MSRRGTFSFVSGALPAFTAPHAAHARDLSVGADVSTVDEPDKPDLEWRYTVGVGAGHTRLYGRIATL
jgi:hypothetical protein